MTNVGNKRSIDECTSEATVSDECAHDDQSQCAAILPDFSNRIKKAIECTCCYEIAGHLKQCRNGHLICSDCWQKCLICPVCRVKREDIRALTIEQMAAGIFVECKNRADGCNVSVQYENLTQHQETCEFTSVPCCPIPGCECCVKINKKNELLKHIMQDHKVRIKERCGNEVRKIQKGMRISEDMTSDDAKMGWSLVEYRQQIFSLVSIQHKDKFSIQMTGIGKENTFGKFFAEVIMYTKDNRKLTWKNEIYTTHEKYNAKIQGRRVMDITLDIKDILESLALPFYGPSGVKFMMLSWTVSISSA